MKRARVRDLWRAVIRAERLRIKLAWKGVAGLTDGDLIVNGPISILCGENGAGKSTVLRLLHEAVGAVSTRQIGTAIGALPVHQHLILSAERQSQDGPIWVSNPDELGNIFFTSGAEAVVALFDPALQIPRILQIIRADTNFSDLTNGIEPRVANVAQLARIAYIVGRDYDAVEIYEIDAYEDVSVFPYFRVTVAGITYASEMMGLGELSALTAYWMAESLPPRSVLLVEELETYLAPNSQMALLNHFAECALDRKLLIVMTSHSGQVVSRVSGSNVVHLSRFGGITSIVSNPGASILTERLGLVPEKRLLLLVEDVVAKFFCEALMDVAVPRLGGHHDYIICDGHTHISRILQELPCTDLSSIAIVGIYDGDVRWKEIPRTEWSTLKLPGIYSPELVIKNFITGKDLAYLAAEMKIDERSLGTALAAAQGQDPHDWILQVSKILLMHVSELVRRVVRIIVEEDAQFANEFSRKIEALSLAG